MANKSNAERQSTATTSQESAPGPVVVASVAATPIAPAAQAVAVDLDEYFALEEQLRARRQGAIDAIMRQRSDLDEKLARLGLDLNETSPKTRGRQAAGTMGPSKPRKKYTRSNITPTCEVCNGAEGHDKRAHRSHPEKFTKTEQAELSAKWAAKAAAKAATAQ